MTDPDSGREQALLREDAERLLEEVPIRLA